MTSVRLTDRERAIVERGLLSDRLDDRTLAIGTLHQVTAEARDFEIARQYRRSLRGRRGRLWRRWVEIVTQCWRLPASTAELVAIGIAAALVSAALLLGTGRLWGWPW